MRSVLIQAQQEMRRFGEIDERTIELLTKAEVRKLETDRRIVERKRKIDKSLAARRGKQRIGLRRPSGRQRTRAAWREVANAHEGAETQGASREPELSRRQVGLGGGNGQWLSPFADAVAIGDVRVRGLLPLLELETHDPLFDAN
jgi:hypothetical protein